MTKVQLRYELLRPLDHILVEYDASRLTRGGMEAKLHGAGIPVKAL
jgi:hypothetical protein